MDTANHYLKLELDERVQKDLTVFEFLQQGSLDGIWYWDLENPEVEWMSPRFWELLGYDYREMQHLASEWQDLIHPDDLQTAITNLTKHCEDPNHPYDQVVRYRHKDGSTVWVRCRGIALRDDSGKPLRMLGAHTDLTALKQAEEALRESEERFRHLAENIEDVFWLATPGIAELLYVSPAFETVWGRTVESHYQNPKAFLDAVHPDDRERFMDELPRHRRGEFGPVEYRIVRPDGSVRWIRDKGFPVRKNGKLIALSGIASDITARKQTEEDLRSSLRQIEIANEELTQYNYVVAHDLKAPFRAISNYSHFLQEDLADLLNPEQQLYLEKMHAAANEADSLLGEMLHMARLRQHELMIEPVELGPFLEKLIISMALPAAVQINIADDWPTLHTDPQLLRQIFQNLIENAVVYNNSSPKKVELGWLKVHGVLECYIRDNGLGIAPQYQKQIFRMFERLHTSAEYPGSGVGLAIVQKALDKLGGAFRLESIVGQGTTFFLTLPDLKNQAEL